MQAEVTEQVDEQVHESEPAEESVYSEHVSIKTTMTPAHIEFSESSSSDSICIVKPVARNEDA